MEKNLFLPPMRGSCPGTLLSSRRWEVQFQDIVIEIVHTNTTVQHTNLSSPTELLTVNVLFDTINVYYFSMCTSDTRIVVATNSTRVLPM